MTPKIFSVLVMMLIAVSLSFAVMRGYSYGYHPSDGHTGHTPLLSVDVSTSCNGNTVTVSQGTTPVSGAWVSVAIEGDGNLISGNTADDGTFTFRGCGMDVSIHASKSGNLPATVVVSLPDCQSCGAAPAPECTTDSDCASDKLCSNGQCIPVQCDCGSVQSHACVAYRCCTDTQCPQGQVCTNHACVAQPQCTPPACCTSDDQCSATQACAKVTGAATGTCQEITGCGTVESHKLVPYQCGTEAGCQPCPSGQTCTEHKCVGSDLKAPTSGFVGGTAPVEATEDGAPCKNCELQITDPTGKKLTGTTDGNGNFNLPLNIQGIYSISLFKDGQVIKTVQVNALPKAAPGEGTTPTAAGGDLLPLGILVLLILIVIGLYVASRRKKK